MRKKKPSSNSYDVGYGRPPKKFRFKRGKSGNPSGKRRKASAPDLKAQLQSALNKTVTIRSGKHPKVISKGAAGIEQLVDQFAAGDRNARRDLMVLAEKLGIDLTAGHSQAIESALEENLAAEDEDLLADFVQRHGGHYHRRDDSVGLLPRQKSNGPTLPLNCSNPPALPREHLDDV
jgi:uncharacterized protein DUF5681